MHSQETTHTHSGPLDRLPKLLLLLGMVFAVLPACQGPSGAVGEEIRLPEPSDWTDEGVAVDAGADGTWDMRLSGALSPATVIKHGGLYHLYYIGADGNREAPPGDDGGPRHRALGVATSQDGIHFTKYGGNPVIKFLPTPDGINAQEEGVFSAAAASDGEAVTLYFGGMTMTNGGSVRIDIYHTTSADGLTFGDATKVLDAEEAEVWGNDGRDDEILPAGLLRNGATWNLYYLTKNRDPRADLAGDAGDAPDRSWDYGMVSGSQSNRLGDSRPVLLQADSTLGGEYRQLSANRIGPGEYALFLINYDPTESMTNLELRIASATQPDALSEPQIAHTYPGQQYAIVFLDEAAGKWFMYHRQDDDPEAPIRVKTAPVDYVER